MNNLAITPDGLSLEGIKDWLLTQPRPSGWYATRAAAIEESARTANPEKREVFMLTPKSVRAARQALGMTKVQFGKALGFGGNQNTVNKAVYDIEHKKDKPLRRDKQEILFGLMAAHGLIPEKP